MTTMLNPPTFPQRPLDTASLEFTRAVKGHIIPVAGTYQLDIPHTMVSFVTRALARSQVRGRFTDFSGTVTIGERPEDSSTAVVIRSASIDTGSQLRDRHLRSGDFLDSKTFPTLEFRSTALEPGDVYGRWKMTGNLTLHGQTHPVQLGVLFLGAFEGPWGGHRIGFEATTEIDRARWGLCYDKTLAGGRLLVGRKVHLDLAVTALYRDSSRAGG